MEGLGRRWMMSAVSIYFGSFNLAKFVLIILIISNGSTFLAANFAVVFSISLAECFEGILRVSSSTMSSTLKIDLN